jgi:hypothetical protein
MRLKIRHQVVQVRADNRMHGEKFTGSTTYSVVGRLDDARVRWTPSKSTMPNLFRQHETPHRRGWRIASVSRNVRSSRTTVARSPSSPASWGESLG